MVLLTPWSVVDNKVIVAERGTNKKPKVGRRVKSSVTIDDSDDDELADLQDDDDDSAPSDEPSPVARARSSTVSPFSLLQAYPR